MFKKLRQLTLVVAAISLSTSAVFAQKAADFSLAGDKGKVTLSEHRNKVVYVDFWASWCKPCRKSFPFMNDMQKRYGEKGLEIIGINLDSDRASAMKFLKQTPANFTVAYDPEGKTPASYGLKVMPTSYLIDRKGNLINIHKGFKDNQKAALEKEIKQALLAR